MDLMGGGGGEERDLSVFNPLPIKEFVLLMRIPSEKKSRGQVMVTRYIHVEKFASHESNER